MYVRVLGRQVYLTNDATFKTLMTFHYTDGFIGILILADYNPHIIGWYHPLYQTTNWGFEHCSNDAKHIKHIFLIHRPLSRI